MLSVPKKIFMLGPVYKEGLAHFFFLLNDMFTSQVLP